jgi:hypothetical protein
MQCDNMDFIQMVQGPSSDLQRINVQGLYKYQRLSLSVK